LCYLIEVNFVLYQINDFIWFYQGGEQLLKDPENLYKVQKGFVYFPIFAIFVAFTISIFPLLLAHYIFYFINITAAILCILEFNKILYLLKINDNKLRFLLLMTISNGFIILKIFSQNQTKFIIASIILFVLRREFQYHDGIIKKDMKYFFINYFLFLFAVGMYPVMILFFILYLFINVNYKEILKKQNVKLYALTIFIFSIQNFLFFVYPNLIFDFIYIILNHDRGGWIIFYLKDLKYSYILHIPDYVENIFTLLLIVITLFLLLLNHLKLEKKFGFLALGCVYFSPFTYLRALVIYLPLILIITIPFIKIKFKGSKFVKMNLIPLIIIAMIISIYFYIPEYVIFNYFPLLSKKNILKIFVYSRYVLVVFILGICIFILHFKGILISNKSIEIEK